MPSVIAPVELELMDGRSTKLRLSHGAMIRLMRATGIDIASSGLPKGLGELEAIGKLLWECSDVRKDITQEEFSDLLEMGAMMAAASELMGRYIGGGNGKRPLAEASASPGPSDGPSGDSISDSVAESSGDSAP
jgi:hypothetical protein